MLELVAQRQQMVRQVHAVVVVQCWGQHVKGFGLKVKVNSLCLCECVCVCVCVSACAVCVLYWYCDYTCAIVYYFKGHA